MLVPGIIFVNMLKLNWIFVYRLNHANYGTSVEKEYEHHVVMRQKD